MKKDLLEESTKKRLKKLAGINEGRWDRIKADMDMYNRLSPPATGPDTSVQDAERKKYSRFVPLAAQALEKAGLELSPDDVNAVVQGVLETRSSHERHKNPPSPITKAELLSIIGTLESLKNSAPDIDHLGRKIHKISDEGLEQIKMLDLETKQRMADLEQPLTPEEEAALQPADQLPASPEPFEMPGEEDPEVKAAKRARARDRKDLLNRGMFGVGRPGVAEGKNLKAKKKR